MQRIEELGTGSTALVVAPHPDDDVLGCGGTIARLITQGVEIDILYVTDGAASHRGSRQYPPWRLRMLREAEARVAAGCLGVHRQHLHFLREPDSGLAALHYDHARLVRRLRKRILKLNPTIVFAPWQYDRHADHQVTARAIHEATLGLSILVFSYDVWPSVQQHSLRDSSSGHHQTVDVRRHRGQKAAALQAHESQLGRRIFDATEAFQLPPELCARTADEFEYFVVSS